MQQLRPLGPAGRARGVDDVGEVLGAGRVVDDPDVVDGGRAAVVGQLHHARLAGCRAQRGGVAVLRQHEARRGVLEHHPQPRGGVLGVERQECAAGLEDGQHAHHQGEAAFHVQADDRLRTHSGFAQPLCPKLGQCIQLPVRHRLAAEAHRDRIRRGAGLVAKEDVRGLLARRGAGAVVPIHEQATPLVGVEQLEAIDRKPGVGHDAGQKAAELRRHACDCRRLEQVGAEGQLGVEPGAGPGQPQGQVELRRAGAQRQARGGDAGHIDRALGKCVQYERGLIQGVAAGVALRGEFGHQAVEGHFGVSQRVDDGCARASQEVDKAGRAVEPAAHHHGVGAMADHVLQPCVAASGHRHADRDVVLPAQAHQQDLERGEEGHERGGPVLLGERLHRGGEAGVDVETLRLPGEAHPRRPRPVGGQFEAGQAAQLCAPVLQIGMQRGAGIALALMRGVGGEGERQFGQAASRAAVGVDLSQFPVDDAHRPAVGHDVMQRQNQQMVFRRDGQQRGAQQRRVRKVEGLGQDGLDALRQGAVLRLVAG
ncbi:hypothetical protein GALL_373390 [mine drainage metagenome]|uniref:Uncharacterized protein n=1 Tax=mine drainage metagenome TaxID=410659 RepID=A0A1J5QBW5_9ZZZZ